MKTLAGNDLNENPEVVYGLQVQGISGNGKLDLKGAVVVDEIPATSNDTAVPNDLERWPYLNHVQLEDPPALERRVEILIRGVACRQSRH